jgi:hypothetical protein
MKLIFQCASIVLFEVIIAGASHANEYCQCISVNITNVVQNQVRWTGKCYSAAGDERNLGSMIFKTREEAQRQTESLMEKYQIKEGDCIQLPGGKMKYIAPKSK